jgi:diguanylate cyclase (GGDEF)-like protein/PAS domain S-box-containing protein
MGGVDAEGAAAPEINAEEHARLLQFMYLMPVGVVSAAADGTVMAINPFAAQVLMPVAASTGFLNLFSILEKIYPRGRALLRDFDGRSGEICSREVAEVPQEGDPRAFRAIEISLSRLGDGAYMGVFNDITDKTMLERDLRFQSERFRMLVEFIHDYVIYTLDTRGHVDTWNKSGERLAGVCNADAIGVSFAEILRFFSAEQCDAEALLARARDEGSCEIECRSVTANGEEVWFEKAITRLSDKHGELAGYSVIAHNVTEHKRLQLRLKHLSETDPLTGAANRRAFSAQLAQAFDHAQHAGHAVGVAILDIDHFKRLNDHYGHAAGDAALKAFVDRVARTLRKGDVLGRLGGEEFGIVLYGAEEETLMALLERVRSDVAALSVSHEGEPLRFTVSIGASFWQPGDTVLAVAPGAADHSATIEAVMHAADEALYEAKGSGRNRVVQRALN